MDTKDFRVSGGQYVVPRHDIYNWVYDVYIELNNKEVAVVGFTENQTTGALFWQIDNTVIMDLYNTYGNRIEEQLQDIAREYFLQEMEKEEKIGNSNK